MKTAFTPYHFLAYILHPKYTPGKQLSEDQRLKAENFIIDFYSDFLPNYYSFFAQEAPFLKARFNACALATPPSSWWCSLQTSKNPNLNQIFVSFASRLMSAPASSASLERFFSTFGYVQVQSKIRNRLSLQRTAKLVFCNRYLRGKETDIDDSDSDDLLSETQA